MPAEGRVSLPVVVISPAILGAVVPGVGHFSFDGGTPPARSIADFLGFSDGVLREEEARLSKFSMLSEAQSDDYAVECFDMSADGPMSIRNAARR